MKDLFEFKQERLKTDPTAKDLTESQWEKAFEAYKSSRRKLRGSSGAKKSSRSEGRESSSRRRDSSRSRSRGQEARKIGARSEKKRVKRSRHSGSGGSGDGLSFNISPGRLTLKQVRQESAYRELRILIRSMAWIAIVIIVVSVAVQIIEDREPYAMLKVLLTGLLQMVGVRVVAPFLEAMVDLPDIAIRNQRESILKEPMASQDTTRSDEKSSEAVSETE